MRRILKILHELATVGYMGAIVVIMVLLVGAKGLSPEGYVAIRAGIAAVSTYVFMPSLGLVLLTGIAAMAANPAFQEAEWAWGKLLLGVVVFEGSLIGIAGNADRAALVAVDIVAGVAAPDAIAAIERHEWGALWIMLVVSVINIVLGVWRPRTKSYLPSSTSASKATGAAASLDGASL
jgi:hypothetical protein